MTELQKHLTALGACRGGLEFAGNKTASETWTTCDRPDWLGWWLAKTNTDPENRRLAALYCRLWREDIAPLLPSREQEAFIAILDAISEWYENPSEENRKKALVLARALALALDLDIDLDLDRARAIARALARDLDLARALALDLDLDRALDIKWCDAIRAEFACPLVEGGAK